MLVVMVIDDHDDVWWQLVIDELLAMERATYPRDKAIHLKLAVRHVCG